VHRRPPPGRGQTAGRAKAPGCRRPVPGGDGKRIVAREQRLLGDGVGRSDEGRPQDEQRAGVEAQPLAFAECDDADACEGEERAAPGDDRKAFGKEGGGEERGEDRADVDNEARRTGRLDRPTGKPRGAAAELARRIGREAGLGQEKIETFLAAEK
jgi:hypothetical protein